MTTKSKTSEIEVILKISIMDINEKLMKACLSNSLDEMKVLCEQGADINYKNEEGVSILQLACYHGFLEIVRYILTRPDWKTTNKINDIDKNQPSLLIYAAIGNQTAVAQYLLTSLELNERADIHLEDEYGWNALHSACIHGCLDVVQYLLTSEDLIEHANIHKKDKLGENALMLAAEQKEIEIMQYLLTSEDLKEKANIHDIDNQKQNVLDQACRRNNIKVVEYLMGLDGEMLPKRKDGYNLLMYACREGRISLVKELLTQPKFKKDNNINHPSDSGNTALISASHGAHLNIVKYLLTSEDLTEHANIYYQDSIGKTALMYAAVLGHIDIVNYLLSFEQSNILLYQRDKKERCLLTLTATSPYTMSKQETNAVIQTLIMNYNYQVDKNTIKTLKESNREDVIEMIRARDNMIKNYNKLNDSLKKDNIQKIKRQKI